MGIDSVMRPKADRIEAWQRLSELAEAQYLILFRKKFLFRSRCNAEALLKGEIRAVVVNCKE